MHRALQVRSTLAWLTAATLDEDRPLAETLLGSPEPARPHAGRRRRRPPAGRTAAAGGAPSCRTSVADGRSPRGRRPGATTSSPPTRCRGRARARRAPSTLACGVLVLPLPDGPVRRSGSAARRSSTSTGAATRTTRRSPSARATRCGSARASPSTGGGETVRDRSEPWTPQQVAEAGELRTHLLEALYARSRSVVRAAETLQRSLLSDPPAARRPGGGRALRARRARRPRSAATGTTCSGSPTARRCSSSATSSATTPRPPPAWPSCAGCCAGIAYDSADGPGRRARPARHRDRRASRLGAMATVLVGRLEPPATAGGMPAALGQRRAPAAAA